MTIYWEQAHLCVSARGLTTSLTIAGSRGLEIQFDFIDQQRHVWTTDAQARSICLQPYSIAEFYEANARLARSDWRPGPLIARPVETVHTAPLD